MSLTCCWTYLRHIESRRAYQSRPAASGPGGHLVDRPCAWRTATGRPTWPEWAAGTTLDARRAEISHGTPGVTVRSLPLPLRSLPSSPHPAAAALLAAKNEGMLLDAGRRFLLVLASALHDDGRDGPAELLRITKASIARRVGKAKEAGVSGRPGGPRRSVANSRSIQGRTRSINSSLSYNCNTRSDVLFGTTSRVVSVLLSSPSTRSMLKAPTGSCRWLAAEF